jgi:hypothetical protein
MSGLVGSSSIFSRTRRTVTVTVERLLAIEGLAGMLQQKREQVKFPGREGKRDAVSGNRSGGRIKRKWPEGEWHFWRQLTDAPAQDRLHPQYEFPRRERLGQVVVCTCLEAVDAVVGRAECCQQHDRHGGGQANATAHLCTVDSWEHAIEHDEVWSRRLRDLESLESVGRCRHDEAGRAQVGACHLEHCCIIFDKQNASISEVEVRLRDGRRSTHTSG